MATSSSNIFDPSLQITLEDNYIDFDQHIFHQQSSSSANLGASSWFLKCNRWSNQLSRRFRAEHRAKEIVIECLSHTISSSLTKLKSLSSSSNLSFSHSILETNTISEFPTRSPSGTKTKLPSPSLSEIQSSSKSTPFTDSEVLSASTSTSFTDTLIPPVPPYVSPLKVIYTALTQASIFSQLTSPSRWPSKH